MFVSGTPAAPLWQAAITLLVALDVLLRVVTGTPYDVPSWPAAAVLFCALLMVASVAVPWRRLPLAASVVLPVADVLVVGLLRLSPDSGGSSVIVVVPAVWMATLLGRRGVVLTVVTTVLLLSVPGVVYLGATATSLTRGMLFPVVAGLVAALVAFGYEALREGRAEAEERGRRLAEALDALRHQQEVNATVLDAVDVGLVLLDADGRYVAVNRRHQDFLDLAYPDGHRGQAGQLGAVLAEDRRTVLGRADMPTVRALAGEEFDDLRIWVGDDPAERRALSVSARVVRAPDGSAAGAALAYTDVTELVRALRVKDEFVAAVSHELRTPLTSIVGYVDLVRDDPGLPPVAARQLAVVARNAERLLRLVEDLLVSVSTSARELSVQPVATDLAAVVREGVAAASATAGARDLTLTADLPGTVPVVVDPVRIAQVVDNLVGNAVKYTPPGGHVRVALATGADDPGVVELVVEDDGPGIPAADVERIFTRFYRTRSAEDGDVPGLGLGLFITQAVVEAHGGTIAVDPDRPRGTCVRVRLPRGGTGQPPAPPLPASSTQAVPTRANPTSS